MHPPTTRTLIHTLTQALSTRDSVPRADVPDISFIQNFSVHVLCQFVSVTELSYFLAVLHGDLPTCVCVLVFKGINV